MELCPGNTIATADRRKIPMTSFTGMPCAIDLATMEASANPKVSLSVEISWIVAPDPFPSSIAKLMPASE